MSDRVCARDGTVIDSMTAIAVATTIQPSPDDAAPKSRRTDGETSAVGAQLGKYTVEEFVGRGGMGAVYRARHSELGLNVAIKIMNDRVVGSGEAHARFLREARAAARIEHVNVIRVIDYAQHPDFGSYLVMDFLKGKSLDQVLAIERRFDETRIISIALQICEALSVAHEAGVVHRDLKPANIFLTGVEGEESVKVMDFGVAKLASDEGASLTRPGSVLGTPLYMSPEQWDHSEVDARSDIYSFGVLLYEMSTGDVPVRGAGLVDMARNLATKVPLAPRVIRPELSPSLEAIILRCISPDRGARFQTMRDVGEALRLCADKPMGGSRRPVGGRMLHSNAWRTGLAGAALVVAICGVTVGTMTLRMKAARLADTPSHHSSVEPARDATTGLVERSLPNGRNDVVDEPGGIKPAASESTTAGSSVTLKAVPSSLETRPAVPSNRPSKRPSARPAPRSSVPAPSESTAPGKAPAPAPALPSAPTQDLLFGE